MLQSFYTAMFLILTLPGFCQSPVLIPVETKDNAVLLQTDKDGRLCIVYSGSRLSDSADYNAVAKQLIMNDGNTSTSNNVYTPAGTWNLLEPALQVRQADGNYSVELKYAGHTTSRGTNSRVTKILLKDPVYPVEVSLFYEAFYNENVIKQWTVIRNTGKKSVMLEKYASANLYFADKHFFLRQYHGSWAREMRPEESELTAGIKVLDSKLGTRANLFQPPSFALSFGRPATENEGTVMLGTLAWTGNFKFEFEKDSYDHLRLIAGINPYASAYELKPSANFETPAFIYTISHEGLGTASRNLHKWATNYQIADGKGSRLTLLNNWEATDFNFNEQKIAGLFKGAKELGVDMFLLDDGWFGNKYPRNNDSAGLGDWQENKLKLPHGVGYLVQQASAEGIKFGIWVEPEMVNPKSELYENHRDWVIRQPGRKEYYFRNQLVLDMSNPAVQKFVFNIIDSLFIRNPDLAFIKWDCNAVIYNANSEYEQKNKASQNMLYVNYVKGLYDVLQKLRDKYPKVPMMLCSGGGGRVDYGALRYFTEYWPSDNTDPMERIFIQWENSYFFPSIASCNHVTNWSHAPLKFRTDVAMMGKLGFDIVVDKLSPDDRLFARQAVAEYKKISDLVWHGDLYRLSNPWDNDVASLMYVSADKSRAVAFNYLVESRYIPGVIADPIKFRGLDPEKNYMVQEINLYPGKTSPPGIRQVYSGDMLMKVGINPVVDRSRSSVVLSAEVSNR